MGKAMSDSDKHIFSAEKPFSSSSGGSSEEAKDAVDDMISRSYGAQSSSHD